MEAEYLMILIANISSVTKCFKRGDEIEICDGIIFNFYKRWYYAFLFT